MRQLALFSVCLLVALPIPLWAQDCRVLQAPNLYPAEMRSNLEQKIQFTRTLCRYLVPAWSDYLGKHKESYLEGFRKGARFVLTDLDWGTLDPEEIARTLKGKSLGFRMGFLAAAEAYVVLQRQSPAVGLNGKPVAPSLHLPVNRSVLRDDPLGYWEAVEAVFIPHWGAYAQGHEQDYQRGFRDSVAHVLREFRSAPTNHRVRTALQKIAAEPSAYQMGFVAALEAYSAYQLMSSERQTPGIHPLSLIPPRASGDLPIVASYDYDQPYIDGPEGTSDLMGKSALDVLGRENIARIVAFTNPGVDKRTEVPLENCKQAFEQFVVTGPLSIPGQSVVNGFIELKDGRIIRWFMDDHFGMLHIGKIEFYRTRR